MEQHPVRRGAHEHVVGGTVAVRTDDDVIGRKSFRLVENEGDRGAEEVDGLDRQASCRRPGPQMGQHQIGGHGEPGKVCVPGVRMIGGGGGGGGITMEDHDAPMQGSGQRDGGFAHAFGDGGEVNGGEDRFRRAGRLEKHNAMAETCK